MTTRNRKSRVNWEIEKIAKWARSQGWTVEDDGSGHTRFYNRSGGYVTDYPATPSRPRKGGLQVPPPSKKEQRARRQKSDGDEERGRDNEQEDET